MSEIATKKAEIESEFSKINQTNQIIAQNLRDAKASGDDEKYQSLVGKLKTVKKREEFLQGQYTSLQEQEAKPEQERISKLGEELRQSYVSPPPRGYAPYGLMPGAPDSTVDLNVPTRQEQIQRKRDIVAQTYNLPKKGDEKIPTSLMAQIETLPDPRSKAQLLENTYGKGTVLPVDIAGDTEFFVKLPDGGVKTTLDKGVAALAGIAAETPALAAEIGSFLGIVAATKSPILAVAGSSAAGAGVGAGIDEALRFTYGLESDFGNTLARRGGQALIGAGIGGVTDVAIPIMRSARIPNPFENKFAQELEGAAERLMTSEQKLAAREGRKAGQIQVPAGARLAGQEGIEMQSELAGTYARSNITSAALTTQETLLRLANNIKGKIPANPNDFADIAARKEAQKNALSGNIASLTGRSTRIIDAALERQTKGQLSNTDNLGKILRDEIKNAEDQAIKDTTQQYGVLADVAERANFQTSAKELLERLPEIKARINPGGAFDEAAVSKVEQDLIRQRDAPVRIYDAGEELKSFRKSLATLTKERLSGKKISKTRLNQIKANELRYQGEIQNLTKEIKELQGISGPLDFRAFDAYIRRFNDARPDNAVGGTTKDVFGVGISKELSEFRRNVYSRVNVTYPDGTVKNLGDEFQTATELVKERAAFEKNTLGGILKEAAGEQAATPRDIVSAVLKEPFTVNKVTQALRKLGESDPTKAGDANRVLGLLQLEYMNNIGIGRGGATNVQVDTGMLDSLFGKEAAAQKRSIEELNRNIGKIKGLDASNLSFDDIKRMGQSLSETERKSLAKTITKRLQDEKEEERLVNSSVFKLAKKGNFNNIDPDTLSKAILSSSSTTTDAIVAMRELSGMSLEARNLYKGDFMRELLDQFPGGTPTANAPFETLFDTKKFIAAYKSPNETGKTPFAKKLEVVLGQEQARELYDIARLYEANIVTNTSAAGFNPRFVATNRGVVLGLPLGQLLLSTKNRIITGMLSSASQRNALKKALSKTAMPGVVNDAYNKMAKEMFLTRTGLTALAHQASNDPEFSAELTNMANEFQEKEGLDLGGK